MNGNRLKNLERIYDGGDDHKRLVVVPDSIPAAMWRPYVAEYQKAHPDGNEPIFVTPEALGMRPEACPACGFLGFIEAKPTPERDPARCCTRCSGERVLWGDTVAQRLGRMGMMAEL